MAEMVAETERLRLREWERADEGRFYAVMNRPEVMRYLGGVQTPEEWNAAYRAHRRLPARYGHTFWIVEDARRGDILGFCGLKRVNAPGAGRSTGKHRNRLAAASGSVGARASPRKRRSPAWTSPSAASRRPT